MESNLSLSATVLNERFNILRYLIVQTPYQCSLNLSVHSSFNGTEHLFGFIEGIQRNKVIHQNQSCSKETPSTLSVSTLYIPNLNKIKIIQPECIDQRVQSTLSMTLNLERLMSFRQNDVVLANFEGHVMSHKRTEMLSGISLKRQYPKLWESITLAQKSSFSVSDNNVTALVHRIEFIGRQHFYLIKIVNDDDLIPPYFYIVIVLLSLFLGGGYYLSQLRKEKNTLKKLSYTDQLSGLHNRHYLSEISRQLACDKRYHLCIFDIDHFKRVNDKYGHDIGDQVIKRVADVLKSQMKMGDMAFRIGGEEFLVIMKVDSREVAIHRVERIRKMVQELPQKPSVSISGGLCCINRPIEEVIKCADAQLYQAKQSGRNIIVC